MTETYEGVANDGLSGFFSGLTWGLIGTVSKPALGVLDLATGAATAVKESSRSKYRVLPPKLRPPRYIYIYFFLLILHALHLHLDMYFHIYSLS